MGTRSTPPLYSGNKLRIDRWQVKGRLAVWLVADAVQSAELRVQQVLEIAVASWRERGFDSFDASENAFTVRLYSHCINALASSADFALFHVSWEGPQPTNEILEGLAAPARSVRPDMYFSVGDKRVLVEAKRLDGTPHLYREYVREGMKRFWEGRYVSDPGIMFAYLLGPSHLGAQAGINAVIVAAHAATPADDRCLRDLTMLAADFSKAVSSYPSHHTLWHFAVAI